jgi:hypothetical protein
VDAFVVYGLEGVLRSVVDVLETISGFITSSTRIDGTLIERKSSVPQIRCVKGEAVVTYCKLLTTKEMGRTRLSQRVYKKERLLLTYISLIEDL